MDRSLFDTPTDRFADRHIGPDPLEVASMLELLGYESLSALVDAAVPRSIRVERPLALPAALTEAEALDRLLRQTERNRVLRSLIGMGYHDTWTPPVIQRNILENPGWYTQYTPYQSEIAQGRMEALVNFQTMVAELTGLPLANASLLDEGTAAAEALHIAHAHARGQRDLFFAAEDCHPQTLAVLATRARPLGIEIESGPAEAVPETDRLCGALLQVPATDGSIRDATELVARVHASGALAIVATDLLALTLVKSPAEMGADIAVGSSQRFGVPLAAGGPHAAFMAVRQTLDRLLPGRIVGISVDAEGRPAMRLARQTREQHIRREKATSNICTAQVLLAIMAGMYAVYHGPEGLRRIARRVHGASSVLVAGLERLGLDVGDAPFFDTLKVALPDGERERVLAAALERGINLRRWEDGGVGIALDERITRQEVEAVLASFAGDREVPDLTELEAGERRTLPAGLERATPYLTQGVFNSHHSEHEMLRYLFTLQERDISLAHSMIPLGSCTMKLNATAEMVPVTWPQIAHLHPFAPADQMEGYAALYRELEAWLAEITGFTATSLQPNAGSQGEYTGLLVIRAWHERRGEGHRDVCLIPRSAHGTNPASATMAGLEVVVVDSTEDGSIDLADLEAEAERHADRLAALMITYPSTHGVFEEGVRKVCEIVHRHGGQVYLDGANMNAQVGLCRPGDYGADVCHLNLHKTFCIPHGGGGPGVGPICVAEHLAPFLPGHPLLPPSDTAIGPVAAAPYGSAGILPISWMYIAMMGPDGLTRASQVAILNANYMARRLAEHYPVLYAGRDGLVAHEFILDLRHLKETSGIQVEDVAKRLIDFGFHAPTMSWPVAGTMMIEPTESEDRRELDRFCEAMIAIREEIRAVEEGRLDREDNPLKRAPHTARAIADDAWDRPYSRQQAALPLPWVAERKFWPPVARVDNVYGDRNLVCTCEPLEASGGDGGA